MSAATRELRILATDVDSAITILETAVNAYVQAAHAAHGQHVIATGNPHPTFERAHEFALAAMASRPQLARYLKLSPINPPISVAAQHPEWASQLRH